MPSDSVMKVAVFGLGSMGYGMALSFLRAGHAVHGFDLVPEDDAAVAKLYARNSELGLPGEV